MRIWEAPMMSERQVKKRAVNLFVDADLLDEARRLRINISDTLERRLRMIVKVEREKLWLEENREAIASINSFIDQHGLLASRLRYRNSSE
jgi:antitoxin CcdA